MPIIKSARKRVKVATTANLRNVRTKRTMREAMKALNKAVATGKPADIAKAEKLAMSAIDIASKKAVIHKNKAARKKAQVSTIAKNGGMKIAKTTKKPAAKSAPAKPAAKAKPASKTAKPPAKKPAAKKPAASRAKKS